MATVANRGPTRLSSERRFFAAMAIIIAVATFAGFAPSYYLAPMFGAKPLSILLHIHGMVFTAWILVYVAQTALIAARRTDIHRIVGPLAVVLAIVMVPLGIATAIVTKQVAAAAHLPPQGPPLIFPLGAIVTFAVLVGAGTAMRNRAAWHKRLMLLGTAAILTTPLARVTRILQLGMTPAIGGIVFTDILLGALVVYDIRTRGRLHAATAWGGAFFLATQALRILLNMTPAWQGFAKSITG
jgi:hypothetical protein